MGIGKVFWNSQKISRSLVLCLFISCTSEIFDRLISYYACIMFIVRQVFLYLFLMVVSIKTYVFRFSNIDNIEIVVG